MAKSAVSCLQPQRKDVVMSHVPGELIVIFKKDVDYQKVIKDLGLKMKDVLTGPFATLGAIALIEVPAGSEAQWTARLDQREDVQSVGLNHKIQIA